MNESTTATLPDGRFEGREAFAQAVRDALSVAAAERWRQIVLCDPSFIDWPLGERSVAASLQAWAHTGGRCTLLARRWDGVTRRHARFVQWRQDWSHIIEARACPSADELDLPSAIWSPAWALQRLDLERCNGYSGREPRRRLLLRETLQGWLQRSIQDFPSSTTGL